MTLINEWLAIAMALVNAYFAYRNMKDARRNYDISQKMNHTIAQMDVALALAIRDSMHEVAATDSRVLPS